MDEAGPVERRNVTLDHSMITETERKFHETFEADAARELELLDAATAALLFAVVHAGQSDGRTPRGRILNANIYLGSRGLRAVRAGRAVLACGYEAEARAQDRVVLELAAHRKAILADETGAEADRWLAGKSVRGISRKVAELLEDDTIYAALSSESHGDPRPIHRMLDQERNRIVIAPGRTIATRNSLLLYAGFAREQAAVIANLASDRLMFEGIHHLEGAIQRASDDLLAELG